MKQGVEASGKIHENGIAPPVDGCGTGFLWPVLGRWTIQLFSSYNSIFYIVRVYFVSRNMLIEILQIFRFFPA